MVLDVIAECHLVSLPTHLLLGYMALDKQLKKETNKETTSKHTHACVRACVRACMCVCKRSANNMYPNIVFHNI